MHFTSLLQSVVAVISLFVASLASFNDNKNVPLAIITSNSIQLTPAKVGNVVSSDLLVQTTFSAILENVDKVVFVVLPKLSFPRLLFDANYNNKKDTQYLSKALGSMSSVIYPAVSNIEHLFDSVDGGMTVLHLKSPNDLTSEEILNAGRRIQIKMDATSTLHDSDETFGRTLKMLNGSTYSFAVVYTAEESDEWISGVPQSLQEGSADISSHKDEALARYKREVTKKTQKGKYKAANERLTERLGPGLEEANQTIIAYGTSCFLLYATRIEVEIHNSSTKATASAELPKVYRKPQDDDHNCTVEGKNKQEAFNFTLDYGSVGNFTELKMTYGVKMLNAWEWHVHKITVSYKTTKFEKLDDGEIDFKPGPWLTAQLLFSYHCNVPEVTRYNDPSRSLKAELRFGTIQAQAYEIKPDKKTELSRFGYQCDCVGFFTSAIWAGLVVSVIYLLIIALAMIMLMNLETMDRFEDPKGQALKIQASG